MKIDKKKLLDNFKHIKNVANLNILKCIKKLFSKIGILENIGFFILLIIIIFRIISLFIFYIKFLYKLQKRIKYIAYSIKHLKLLKKHDKRKELESKITENKIEPKGENEIKLENNNINNNINFMDNENENKITFTKKKKKIKKKRKRKSIIKTEKEIHFNITYNDTIINNNINNDNILNNNIDEINNINTENDNHYNIINIKENKDKKPKRNKNKSNRKITRNYLSKKKPKIDKQKKIEILKRIMDYTDDEINELPYNLALQFDKRTYCQYYISLIKTKHNLIFSFFYDKDYNSRIIKMDLFFIGFAANYTVNGLFFNDDTMHNIYVSNGLFDLEYQLPIIVYSSIISFIIDTLMKMLALSNDEILDFKKNKNRIEINKRKKRLFSKLSIKFILYFVISFIFLLFFWYYISMFGAIYTNTQFHLFKDTIISFALSLVYPFGIYLIPGIFRIYALADPKKKREYIYKFSKIFHIL